MLALCGKIDRLYVKVCSLRRDNKCIQGHLARNSERLRERLAADDLNDERQNAPLSTYSRAVRSHAAVPPGPLNWPSVAESSGYPPDKRLSHSEVTNHGV